LQHRFRDEPLSFHSETSDTAMSRMLLTTASPRSVAAPVGAPPSTPRHCSVALRAGRRARQRSPTLLCASKKPAEQQREAAPTAPSEAPSRGSGGGGGGSSPPPGKRPPAVSRVALLEALESVTDAATDIGRHLGRLASPKKGPLPTDEITGSGDSSFTVAKGGARPVLLVLGSGWAAHSCIKVIDTDKYDVILVSPRNHFLFTPMLPSTAVGTVEFRSLLEPIRTSNEFVGYLEADCETLDLKARVATCRSANTYAGGYRPTFEVPYDLLVVAVGEQPATFGVPGVAEHCSFMKEVSDTVRIRNRIGEAFELASLPGTAEAERRRLLHFVVVGGGPTGVEFAGTLSDYVRSDLRRKYPALMRYVRVSLLQSAQGILTQFTSKLANKALEDLRSTGVEIRTGVRVVQVTDKQVVLKGGEREDYGVCVWSCGNAARPLVQGLVDVLPEQAEYQKGGPASSKLAVDPFLRVIGAQDVLAMGDCTTLVGGSLPATAQVAAQQGSYLAHVLNRGFVVGKGGPDAMPPCRPASEPLAGLRSLLGQGSSGGARQSYAELAASVMEPGAKLSFYSKPFEFVSLGMMAYVGSSKAAIDTQKSVGPAEVAFYGNFAFLLWRSVYITKQVSFRNRVLILFDWLKTRVFGRDLSMF